MFVYGCHVSRDMFQETATLADRLVQDQVIRAQKEEEIYVLRRDLNTQRQQYGELQALYDASIAELREYKEKVCVCACVCVCVCQCVCVCVCEAAVRRTAGAV